jgi:arylsulfatase A-like enzyme
MGFDYFYGFMGGETDQWTPYLFRDAGRRHHQSTAQLG